MDYVDLFLLHWPGAGSTRASAAAGRRQVWGEMEALYQEGRVRSIGVSNFLESHLEDLLPQTKGSSSSDLRTVPHVNQIEFNPAQHPVSLYNFCQENGVQGAFLFFLSILLSLTLTPSPSPPSPSSPPPFSSLPFSLPPPLVEGYCPFAKGHMLRHRGVKQIADKYNKTPAQVLLRWSLQRKVVTIPRASSERHLEENLKVFDFELGEGDMGGLNGMHEDLRVTWDPSFIV